MRDRRILITGACGFTGRHLIARLKAERAGAIVGFDIDPGDGVDRAGWKHVRCDLTDAEAVSREVAAARPEVVFHLAARIQAPSAEEFRRVNVDGFRNLLASLRQTGQRCGEEIRLIVVGSAAEIGLVGASRSPVGESVVCSPESDYGRSKLEATRLALAEAADSPLAIVVARLFNLIGPGQDAGSAPGSFARQVLAVVGGYSDAVRCGNLDSRRDFVDVRDAVEAYLALAEHGRPGEVYNVCAGYSCRIGDLLEQLINASGAHVPVVVDPSRFRASDVPDIYGDHGKITRETGWLPRIGVDRSIQELLSSLRSIRRAA